MFNQNDVKMTTSKNKKKTTADPFETFRGEMLESIKANKGKETISESIGGDALGNDEMKKHVHSALVKGENQAEIIGYLLQNADNFPNFVASVFIAGSSLAWLEETHKMRTALLGAIQGK